MKESDASSSKAKLVMLLTFGVFGVSDGFVPQNGKSRIVSAPSGSSSRGGRSQVMMAVEPDVPSEVDVVVIGSGLIGSGLAGLSCAALLSHCLYTRRRYCVHPSGGKCRRLRRE
jgi:hypothetical protein